jgi:hypothetical protein
MAKSVCSERSPRNLYNLEQLKFHRRFATRNWTRGIEMSAQTKEIATRSQRNFRKTKQQNSQETEQANLIRVSLHSGYLAPFISTSVYDLTF